MSLLRSTGGVQQASDQIRSDRPKWLLSIAPIRLQHEVVVLTFLLS